ncbi:glycoprotein [Murid herpesvirus 3]|uniref:Glycoprotein n=2 Tax=Murid betaherpesvirus 3 TaxID=2560603 RepID=A0A1P8VIY5_9BETA|nr:glycoprotein [Murine roseolovirus]APZ76301.1 glycoprotein [Murid betaherpesvirus 3]AYH64754.1 glycoprotein [Murid herpesvirus 3]
MAVSRVDSVNLRIWVLTIITAALTFLNVTIHIVVSHFPDLGFPCAYYEIADYQSLNLSAKNDYAQFNPHLYLDSIQSVIYTVFTGIVFFFILIYYCVCCISVFTNSTKTTNINQATRDISWLGNSSSCFQFVASMVTFQLFVTCLSFRVAMVAAFTYTLYFICLLCFTITMITQYETYERTSFNVSRLHPKLNFTIKYKTALVNIVQIQLGFSGMVWGMILSLGLGNNFFIQSGYVAFGAMNFFLIFFIIFGIIIEVLLFRYVKVQFGFHIGVFFGICGIIYPVLKYEKVYASEWVRGIWLNIIALLIVWAIFTTCRIIRFFVNKKKRYKLLKNSFPAEEETPLQE